MLCQVWFQASYWPATYRPSKGDTVTAAQTQTYPVVPTRAVGPRDGVDDACECFSGSLPRVPLQHFRDNLDNGDPALVDAPHPPKILARSRFDGTSGEEWL